MKNVTIPQPCSENFNLRTTTERGAYCTKCATDTFDFRGKSSQEIKQIFHQHAGKKLCGQLSPEQLETLNAEFDEWAFTSPKTVQSQFLFCLIVVFGLSLFSCTDNNTRQQIENLNVYGIIVPKTDRIEFEQPSNATEKSIFPPILKDSCEEWTRGDIVRTENFENFIAQAVDSIIQPPPIQPQLTVLDGTLYPNPTINSSTLELTIPETDYFTIDVYTTAGSHVSTIHDGTLEQGIFKSEVSLYGVVPGLYLIVASSSKDSRTFRLEKI